MSGGRTHRVLVYTQLCLYSHDRERVSTGHYLKIVCIREQENLRADENSLQTEVIIDAQGQAL